MSFTILANSSTAEPVEVNEDFKWVAQGTVTPKFGATLTAQTSTKDLGAAATRWKKLYCSNIDCASLTAAGTAIGSISAIMWQEVVNYELSSNTTRLEFSGLNGDRDISYLIITKLVADISSTMEIYFNGDSTGTDYRWNSIIYSGGVFQSNGNTNAAVVINTAGGNTTATEYSMSVIRTQNCTGRYRGGCVDSLINATDVNIGSIVQTAFGWTNTASTLTSLVFEAEQMKIGTYIGIWRNS